MTTDYTYSAYERSFLQVYLTNRELEEENEDKDEIYLSTASNFATQMDINLEPIAFLRSLSCQISITDFTLDTLPLFSNERDYILIECALDLHMCWVNQVHAAHSLQKENEKVLTMYLSNVTATSPRAVMDFTNHKLQNLLPFLIQKLSLAYFDKTVFQEQPFTTLRSGDNLSFTLDELKCLLAYIDMTYYVRQTINNFLVSTLTGEEGILSTPAEFTYSHIRPPLSEASEQKMIGNSKYFVPLASRTAAEERRFSNLYTFKQFWGISLASDSSKRQDLTQKILKSFLDYLGNQKKETKKATRTAAHVAFLKKWQENNVKIMNSGVKLQQLVSLLVSMKSPNFAKSLFHTAPISVELESFTAKAKFRINTTAFFSKTDSNLVSVEMSDNLAYALGASLKADRKRVRIGPISSITTPATRAHNNHITDDSQTLPAAVRFQPKVIHVLTDLLSHTEIRDLWLRGTDFEGYHVLYSEPLTSDMLETAFIVKSDKTRSYRKMLRSSNQINVVKLVLCDSNSRQLNFSKGTVLSLGLRMVPLSHDQE